MSGEYFLLIIKGECITITIILPLLQNAFKIFNLKINCSCKIGWFAGVLNSFYFTHFY